GGRPTASPLYRGDHFNAGRSVILIGGHSRNHRRMPMPYRATLPVRSKRGAVHAVLKRVNSERVAEAILSGAIRVTGLRSVPLDGQDDHDTTIRVSFEHIGHNLRLACRSARLLRKAGTGYLNSQWGDDLIHTAGGWGVDVLLDALPDMF